MTKVISGQPCPDIGPILLQVLVFMVFNIWGKISTCPYLKGINFILSFTFINLFKLIFFKKIMVGGNVPYEFINVWIFHKQSLDKMARNSSYCEFC